MDAEPTLRQQIAQALLTAPRHALVDREWLRAELPEGRPVQLPLGHQSRRRAVGRSGGSRGSSVAHALRTALIEFERAGWIQRIGDSKVKILDPEMIAEVAAGRIEHVRLLGRKAQGDGV